MLRRELLCLVFIALFLSPYKADAESIENVIEVKEDSSTFYKAPEKTTDCDGLFASPETDKWLKDPAMKASLEDSNYAPLMPFLKERYGKRKDLCVLEIGALRTTSLAKTLSENTKLYLGVDCADPSAVQQAYFEKEGLRNAKAIAGDMYNLPIVSGSQDVVFVARSTPLGSIYATKESLTRAYNEISRVLKPDGEFILFPEPRKEIRSYDPSASIFREIKRISIPANKRDPDQNPSYMIFFAKR